MIGIYRHMKFHTIVKQDTEAVKSFRSGSDTVTRDIHWPLPTITGSGTFMSICVYHDLQECRIRIGKQWTTTGMIQSDSVVSFQLRHRSIRMKRKTNGKIASVQLPPLKSLLYAPQYSEDCVNGMEQGVSTRAILETIVHDELMNPLTYAILTIGFDDTGKIYEELNPVRPRAEVDKASMEDVSESADKWMELLMKG